MLAAERRLYASPRLRQVICISRMVQTEIHERFGLPRERLPVIYNAIDSAVVQSGSCRRIAANVRARYGIADDACVFLLVGSAYARKGVGRALEALAAVPAPAHLLVVGRDRRPAQYAALARRLGVAHRVTFAGAQTDPRPLLRRRRRVRAAHAVRRAVQRRAGSAGLRTAGRDERPLRRGELVAAHGAGTVCGARDIGAIAAGMRALLDARRTRARRRQRAVAAVRPLTPDAMAAQPDRAVREPARRSA